ncbi:hypothetical protein [Allorhodopirellula solitaria]|uniref:HNH endonuclease n=1 Tax=Allorhodopirellula solitaria TaxID=2527987 RepID=A0A5C5WN01_9BACT|nr:hypothetical protein [Allorhodopirellula solitaria]TWT52008.1 hypothetical protein CA85_51460 [Allorhodopirellula solitaria]
MSDTDKLTAILDVLSGTAFESVDEMLGVYGGLGAPVDEIRNDLCAMVRERTIMWLLRRTTARNFNERTRIMTKRMAELLRIGDQQNGAFQSVVNQLVDLEARITDAENVEKNGTSDTPEASIRDLLKGQGWRCAACGIPLKSHVRRRMPRFAEELEPISEMQLDHVEPFYIAANQTRMEVLCKECNIVKSDRLGVQEDGFVFCANHLRPKNRASTIRRMAFWTTYKTRSCEHDECAATSKDGILLVGRKNLGVAWAYGNLSVWCDNHAPIRDSWYCHSFPDL